MFKKILTLLSFTPLVAMANGVGNGGDICENRFALVRSDVQSWILQGGAVGLRLPDGISFGMYNQSMLSNIRDAKITCTEDKIFGRVPKVVEIKKGVLQNGLITS